MSKLIRDKIPEIAEEELKTHIADRVEYEVKLREKIYEEVGEFLEDPCAEEMADIYEVLSALLNFYNIDANKMSKFRIKKMKEKGKFDNRIILEEG